MGPLPVGETDLTQPLSLGLGALETGKEPMEVLDWKVSTAESLTVEIRFMI